ncbi:nitroreductase family protein [Actinocatenispora rupis]|uniref:nitroreductase family protein n=1 Tax=Actinocatenispora rupis TaxID=519421 RepID=UPI001942AFF8|nr:nitroreductase family protein [Actinocatenispora rupis]
MDATDVVADLVARPVTRLFTADPVPADDVLRMVDAARWTGSARNRQPWRFVAVSDPSLRRTLSTLGAYAQHLAAAPLVLVLVSADDGRTDTEYDLGRVTQSLTLVAATLGYGSCPATLFPAANVATARAVLGVPDGWVPRHALAIGRPRRGARPTGTRAVPAGRLPTEELLTVL